MRGSRPAEKIMSGCAISGILNRKGKRFSGEEIINSIALMHDRSNGQGGGFAAYGIYPEHSQEYALHLFYDEHQDRLRLEDELKEKFIVSRAEEIPTRDDSRVKGAPLIWRYFVRPSEKSLVSTGLWEEEFMAGWVMEINANFRGAYIVSSGKNMGVFKGVGYPEEMGEFYKLEEYQAYLWTAHGRFPTNTPGWWGGAHPFSLLDWSIVHNGELSSYGANKRYLEMFGYQCNMMTDTEVITYIFDLLLRRYGLPLEMAVKVVAAPLWSEIERRSGREKEQLKALRAVYGNLLLNGPFSIILGHSRGFVALNDRIKLRPLVVAEDGEKMYVASEESAIREVCPAPEKVWAPKGGEPVIGLIEGDEQQDEL